MNLIFSRSKQIVLSGNLQKWSAFAIPFLSGAFAIGHYGFSDDYSAHNLVKNNFTEFFDLSLSQGRPLLGLFAGAHYSLIDSYTGFFLTHIASAIIFGIIGQLIYRIIQNRLTIKNSSALSLAVIPLIASPGFNVMVAWGIELGPLVSIALGLTGILKIFVKNRVSWASILLIIQALFFYQPSFMFLVGVFLTFQALSQKSVSVREYLGQLEYSKYLFLVIAFLFQVYMVFLAKTANSSNSRTSISLDVSGKVEWFIQDATRTALDSFVFWGPSRWEMFTIFLFSFFGFHFSIRSPKILKSLPVYILVILVTCSPNLIIAENWASNRSFFPTQWFMTFSLALLILILINSAANRIPFIKLIAICVFLSVGVLSSYDHLHNNWKNPQLKEIELLSKEIDFEACLQTSWVLQSSWTQSLSTHIQFDEYGLPSTAQPWAAPTLFQFYCKDKFNLVTQVKLATNLDEIPKGEEYIDFGKLLGK